MFCFLFCSLLIEIAYRDGATRKETQHVKYVSRYEWVSIKFEFSYTNQIFVLLQKEKLRKEERVICVYKYLICCPYYSNFMGFYNWFWFWLIETIINFLSSFALFICDRGFFCICLLLNLAQYLILFYLVSISMCLFASRKHKLSLVPYLFPFLIFISIWYC